MKVTVTIECETGGEAIAHLRALADQLKQAIRVANRKGEVKKPMVIEDDNCYGSHECTIEDFDADHLFYELERKLYPFHRTKKKSI